MDVQLVMLRALAGMGARVQEAPLRAGDVLAARVLKGGALLLGGVRVPATLPPGLEPGAAVRVKVREVSAERVVLQIVEQATPAEQAQPAAPAPVATFAVPLPGDATARLFVEPDGGVADGGAGAARRPATVTVGFGRPDLRPVDLALAVEAVPL